MDQFPNVTEIFHSLQIVEAYSTFITTEHYCILWSNTMAGLLMYKHDL